VTDTAPRLTVKTPDGEFAPDDPRADVAIAAYVRSDVIKNFDQAKIDKRNRVLTLVPQPGVCIRCQKRLPMFLFRCEHWAVFGFSHAHHLWLCTRCSSNADVLADDGKCICDELVYDAGEWNPFTAPAPGTPEFRRAASLIGPVASYDGTKDAVR
jgi:hypothetical protein